MLIARTFQESVPFGNLSDYKRVQLSRDVHFANGRLKATKGALGIIVGDDRGRKTVLFEDTQHFVELDGSNRRIQSIESVWLKYL